MDFERKDRLISFNGVLQISGHDQPIIDPDDDRPDDRQWMESQYPRHDNILAKLLDRCLTLSEPRLLQRAISPSRWALGSDVDEPLSRTADHPDEHARQTALQAIGWRLRKRNASADPLVKALQHPDPTSQFFAAEGLALGGRAEGLSVLLSAIDFLQDLAFRRRAVVALGELGDARAFDRLLQLASEEGHALQDVAAEAIGHLGRSGKAADIFKLLDRQSRTFGSLGTKALKGLRWLGTSDAWARIREVAAEGDESSYESVAIELLAFNDEPATRDLLLGCIREADPPESYIALRSARYLFGAEAIEPDEAAAQNQADSFASSDNWKSIQSRFNIPFASPLERLRERGDPARLFALLPRCPSRSIANAIGAILLDLPKPPIAEARTALESEHAPTVAAAARILGRAKDSKSGPTITQSLANWSAEWSRMREAMERAAHRPNQFFHDDDFETRGIPDCLAALSWAAARLGTAAEQLGGLLSDEIGVNPTSTDTNILRSTAEALTLFENPPAEIQNALTQLTQDGPPESRIRAADTLARLGKTQATQIASDLLGDPVAFDRVAARAGDALIKLLDASASRLHEQGVVVPHLVASGRIEALASVAADQSLPDASRLGVLEGLASLSTEAAEEHLRRLGLDDRNDEELRKSAWRALRRSKRARSRPPRRRLEVTP